MKAYADLGPIAVPSQQPYGVTEPHNWPSAKAERDKIKNMTLSGSNPGSSGTGAMPPAVSPEGKIDVRRAQDGKLFLMRIMTRMHGGFIDRPTVIVGEGPFGQSKEWVASNAAVSNPTVAPILDILDKSQQAGTIRVRLTLTRQSARTNGRVFIRRVHRYPEGYGSGTTKRTRELTASKTDGTPGQCNHPH